MPVARKGDRACRTTRQCALTGTIFGWDAEVAAKRRRVGARPSIHRLGLEFAVRGNRSGRGQEAWLIRSKTWESTERRAMQFFADGHVEQLLSDYEDEEDDEDDVDSSCAWLRILWDMRSAGLRAAASAGHRSAGWLVSCCLPISPSRPVPRSVCRRIVCAPRSGGCRG